MQFESRLRAINRDFIYEIFLSVVEMCSITIYIVNIVIYSYI